MEKTATFSPCRKYRYTLWRRWHNLFSQDSACVMFIGLNPSTADEIYNDPTVIRCIGYAKDWGYAGLCMMNLFAFKATEPKDMKAAEDSVGPDNNSALIAMAEKADIVVAAWGNHGKYMERNEMVKRMLPKLYYLRLTKSGCPCHPLYLPKVLRPQLWER